MYSKINSYLSIAVVAVSYTHLDGYKRQVLLITISDTRVVSPVGLKLADHVAPPSVDR